MTTIKVNEIKDVSSLILLKTRYIFRYEREDTVENINIYFRFHIKYREIIKIQATLE